MQTLSTTQFRNEKRCERSSPTVYRLACQRRFADIPAQVENTPNDIYWADQYGSTALHLLCISQYVEDPLLLQAVASILKRDPSLAARPIHNTWTPLHLACERRIMWRGSVEPTQLILLLLDACPMAVSIPIQLSDYKSTKNTITPFTLACKNNAAKEVLLAMLRINPTLASAHPTYECYADDHNSEQQHPSNSKYANFNKSPLHLLWNAQKEVKDYDKMELVLHTAFYGRVPSEVDDSGLKTGDSTQHHHNPPFPIVHAVCTIPSPREYVLWVLENYHQEIKQPDASFNLPLHQAIQSANETNDGENTASYTEFLIEALLDHYPLAASIPFGQNRVSANSNKSLSANLLPLHVLVANRHMTWQKGGVRQLTMAWTDALRIPDPRTNLVPALQSAAHAHHSRSHLSTTYELLRLVPDVVQPGYSMAMP